jgi:hypothetical protein
MAHYAWINENNIVVNVTVGVDENIIQGDIGGTSEAWETFYTNAINQEGIYVKRTSYNSNMRGTYAGIGYSYNPDEDIFISPQPFPSWIRNGSFWEAPTPMPTDGQFYRWVEADLNWQVIPTE